MKKQLAGILALAMSLSMASCSSDTGSGEAADETTTTAAAVKDETTAKADDGDTEASQDEEQETTVTEADDNYFEKALAMLPDAELKRAHQEVKVTVYDCELPELAVRLFEEKYGGTVDVKTPSYEERNQYIASLYYNPDLYVSTSMINDFPKLVEEGKVLPIDDLIDFDSDIWSFAKDNKDYMELFNFGGKRFVAVTDVSANGYACFYNKQTIEKHGLDDPWELYKAGNWNWDTMKSMLSGFADAEDLYYGLDGYWYYPRALYYSTGVPTVGLSDGYLVSNLSNQTFLNTLEFGRELFNSGLLYPDQNNPKPELLGEGDLLFYISGLWEIYKAPEKWSMKVSADDIGIVPVPSPAGSAPYQSAVVSGFALSSYSENPQGRELFAQCLALAYSDPGLIAENEQKQKEMYEEYGLSDRIISQINEINELAKQYPVIDYRYGGEDISWHTYYPDQDAFSGKASSLFESEYATTFSGSVEDDNKKIRTYIESLG